MESSNQKYIPFAQRYSLDDRKGSFHNEMVGKQDKICVIVQRHPKSRLPRIDKTKFVCQKKLKFMAIRNQIAKKVDEAREAQKSKKNSAESFFMYINNKQMSSPDTQMIDLYLKYKNQDGYLYMTYGEMESFGAQTLLK